MLQPSTWRSLGNGLFFVGRAAVGFSCICKLKQTKWCFLNKKERKTNWCFSAICIVLASRYVSFQVCTYDWDLFFLGLIYDRRVCNLDGNKAGWNINPHTKETKTTCFSTSLVGRTGNEPVNKRTEVSNRSHIMNSYIQHEPVAWKIMMTEDIYDTGL